ncbi:MAG: flagellin [Legionellales bacterium]|nr:flagellin [Legionellales bacterium]
MASVVNTNIFSLTAQRNLSKSQNELGVALQRLSSGLRINSAKDDAAGLGISTRMTAQINGINQAARNANDAISLAQTTGGALDEMTSNLQRIRELAVQASNASNSSADRASLDAEVQQRIAEISRIASQTSFNGQKVLNGNFGTAQFQVGANVGESISISLNQNFAASQIGRTADYVSDTAQYTSARNIGSQGEGVDQGNALAGANLTIRVGSGDAVAIGASSATTGVTGKEAGSAFAKKQAIDAAGVAGLTVQADTTVTLGFAATDAGNSALTLSINGVSIFNAYNADVTGAEYAAAINENSSATGVTATFDGTNMILRAEDGRSIVISETAAANEGLLTGVGAGISNNAENATLDFSGGGPASDTAVGTIRLTAGENITLAGAEAAFIGYGAASLGLGGGSLHASDVTTVANAETTITRVDAAIETVNTLQGTLGAVQNRFDSVIANLQGTAENLSAARSRVLDADFAAETAKLTKAQILQQAGITILAQANQQPQSVLGLLQ